ncbi:penicillin-insensitive murein endopeptidase [Escherichia coli]|uniref:Penicillin-insensitive murein endopeptidase n=1 Tax=Escherichia coli TaxID=562 RepID=A0A376KTX8_ECOLX|nr:penicillin-insensitive murein endopeptidase [Escherichia coli]
MNKTAIALLALLASSASLAATPWQKITQPVPGSAQSIGSFSNGCIVGADTLPIQSEHYQVMRTDQRRYFGHPDLVMFIQRLSSQVSNLGMGTVLIGDMGMPAGGRFNGGHASHQTGTGCRYLSATAENSLDLRAALAPASTGLSFPRR